MSVKASISLTDAQDAFARVAAELYVLGSHWCFSWNWCLVEEVHLGSAISR